MRLWHLLKMSVGTWQGGGFTPARLDRADIARRLPDLPAWLTDPLLDAFEASAQDAMTRLAKTKKKPGAKKRPPKQQAEDDDV